MRFDPKKIAVDYYFGDLQYWKLPSIAVDALEVGYDGPALRALAVLSNLTRTSLTLGDIEPRVVDSAFREMGIDAPISKNAARMALAIESAQKALNGSSNVFDQAAHIRIHLCELSDPPEALKQIAGLSNESRQAPRAQWKRIEADLTNAFTDFLMRHGPGTTV